MHFRDQATPITEAVVFKTIIINYKNHWYNFFHNAMVV